MHVDFFLAVTDKVCAEAAEYQFKNVGELARDYQRGAGGVYAGFGGWQTDVVARGMGGDPRDVKAASRRRSEPD